MRRCPAAPRASLRCTMRRGMSSAAGAMPGSLSQRGARCDDFPLAETDRRNMSVRIVRLGTPRAADEGLRLGTVRRPPRGVAKADFARKDWYDLWYPLLAPSAGTVAMALTAQTDAQWRAFVKKYRAEMNAPDAAPPSRCSRGYRIRRIFRLAATAGRSAVTARCCGVARRTRRESPEQQPPPLVRGAAALIRSLRRRFRRQRGTLAGRFPGVLRGGSRGPGRRRLSAAVVRRHRDCPGRA